MASGFRERYHDLKNVLQITDSTGSPSKWNHSLYRSECSAMARQFTLLEAAKRRHRNHACYAEDCVEKGMCQSRLDVDAQEDKFMDTLSQYATVSDIVAYEEECAALWNTSQRTEDIPSPKGSNARKLRSGKRSVVTDSEYNPPSKRACAGRTTAEHSIFTLSCDAPGMDGMQLRNKKRILSGDCAIPAHKRLKTFEPQADSLSRTRSGAVFGAPGTISHLKTPDPEVGQTSRVLERPKVTRRSNSRTNGALSVGTIGMQYQQMVYAAACDSDQQQPSLSMTSRRIPHVWSKFWHKNGHHSTVMKPLLNDVKKKPYKGEWIIPRATYSSRATEYVSIPREGPAIRYTVGQLVLGCQLLSDRPTAVLPCVDGVLEMEKKTDVNATLVNNAVSMDCCQFGASASVVSRAKIAARKASKAGNVGTKLPMDRLSAKRKRARQLPKRIDIGEDKVLTKEEICDSSIMMNLYTCENNETITGCHYIMAKVGVGIAVTVVLPKMNKRQFNRLQTIARRPMYKGSLKLIMSEKHTPPTANAYHWDQACSQGGTNDFATKVQVHTNGETCVIMDQETAFRCFFKKEQDKINAIFGGDLKRNIVLWDIAGCQSAMSLIEHRRGVANQLAGVRLYYLRKFFEEHKGRRFESLYEYMVKVELPALEHLIRYDLEFLADLEPHLPQNLDFEDDIEEVFMETRYRAGVDAGLAQIRQIPIGFGVDETLAIRK